MTQSAMALAVDYLTRYPAEAARMIDSRSEAEIRDYLAPLEPEQVVPVVSALTPMIGASILKSLPSNVHRLVLERMDSSRAAALLGQLPEADRDEITKGLPAILAGQLKQILQYPDGTAGRLMDSAVFSLSSESTVGHALDLLRSRDVNKIHFVKLLDKENRLAGIVDVRTLAFNAPEIPLSSIATPIPAIAGPMDPREDIVRLFEAHDLEELLVVDLDGLVLGVIRHSALLDAMKVQTSVDIQTMVGVSKDERALSPSWFALRKRMPWLQINLLTAFLAASVVGLFEETIATFTALAVLLPVVAGQSGNAGAQALAVTMRGLALREITVGQWFRVLRKETNAGFWNGVSIAVTCGIGVFLWSGSIGLVLVICLSMIISMVAAGIAGALVPIVLSRLGQDPGNRHGAIEHARGDMRHLSAFSTGAQTPSTLTADNLKIC